MSRSRLYSPVRLRANSELLLGGAPARYVGKVLRLRPGDSLTVFDGNGGEYAATIARVTKQELGLDVGVHMPGTAESPLRLRLVQGISRGEKMDTVIQKATELGVHRISPVLTEFSVVRLDAERADKRHSHWQKIAQSACEQCSRNLVPSIDPPQSLDAWFADNGNLRDPSLILHAGADDAMAAMPPPGDALTLLVGPEGGFSDAELARAAGAGVRAVSLGPRILRTETAALAALCVAQAAWGDYRDGGDGARSAAPLHAPQLPKPSSIPTKADRPGVR